jgi:hypothetical protein
MNGTTQLAQEMSAQTGTLLSEEAFHLSDSMFLFLIQKERGEAGPENE